MLNPEQGAARLPFQSNTDYPRATFFAATQLDTYADERGCTLRAISQARVVVRSEYILNLWQVQAAKLALASYRRYLANLRAARAIVRAYEAAPRWQREFPDYPAVDMPAIPADWADESWRNETCPHWAAGEGLSVFTDYADPAAREFPEIQRFSVSRLDGDAVWDLFTSDDWAEIIAYVEAYRGSKAGGERPESTYAALREGRETRADAIALKAENDAAARPCPDLARHLATVLGEG